MWTPVADENSGGPHRGIDYANVPPMLARLASLPRGGVDWQLLIAARTSLTIDDLLDAIEIDEVQRSWRDAAQANAEKRRAVTPSPKKRRRR